jgi:uncharacterized glyoxalase superfamily protein PhnB
MNVETVKYVIWANDMERALNFYEAVFNGEIIKRSEVISEVAVAGTTIGIHSGGEGNVTWTGMTFQVADVVQGASPPPWIPIETPATTTSEITSERLIISPPKTVS